jgi:hypothetical protein
MHNFAKFVADHTFLQNRDKKYNKKNLAIDSQPVATAPCIAALHLQYHEQT